MERKSCFFLYFKKICPRKLIHKRRVFMLSIGIDYKQEKLDTKNPIIAIE